MKKLLALVLALVMTMGLMTVSSSAAYADKDSIEHTEAVDILTSLGVVAGKDTGNFDPTGDVKRSEMCKMVMIAQLGTASKADQFKGAKTPLTDIDGTWAEGFIKYCYAQGIISGKSETEFKPNDQVTATEAAKMLLVAIGYNADVQGYKGSQWKINVGRDASLKRFYTDIEDLDADKPLTRDEAAQMVYNAMDATLIQKTSEIGRATGEVVDKYADYDDGRDLMGDKFKAFTFEGWFDNFDYAEKDGKWTITVDNTIAGMRVTQTTPGTQTSRNPAGTLETGALGAAYSTQDFKTTEDVTDLYMQKVKVLYQLDKNYKIDKALGVYPCDSIVVASGKLGDIDVPTAKAKEVKIDGTNYKLTDTADLTPMFTFEYNNMNVVATLDNANTYFTTNGTATNSTDARQVYGFKLIDYTGDDKGDVVVVYPAAVAKVTAVSTSSVTVQYKLFDGPAASASYLRKNTEVYDGIAKDDFVLITAKENSATNVARIEKLDSASGTVSSTKDGNKELIDGDWYNTKFIKTAKAGDKVDYVAYNGFLFDQQGASTTGADDFVVVIDAATEGTNKLGGALTAKVLKADGTKQTIEVKKVNGAAATANTLLKSRMYVLDWDGDDALLYDVNNTFVYANGRSTGLASQFETGYDTIWTGAWDVNAANATSRNACVYGNNANNGSSTAFAKYAGFTADSGKLVPSDGKREAYFKPTAGVTYTVDDDAVIFVFAPGKDVTKTTGAQFKKNTAPNTEFGFFAADKDSNTGYYEIKLAYVLTANGVTTKEKFAFTVEAPQIKQDSDGKYYAEIQAWNGEEVVTFETESKSTVTGIVDTANRLGKKVAFSYELNNSGKIKTIDKNDMNAFFSAVALGAPANSTKAVAITAFKDKTLVEFSNEIFYKAPGSNTICYVKSGTGTTFSYEITDDTEIFFVDLSDGTQGMTDGSVATVSREFLEGVNENDAAGAYVANAIIVTEDYKDGYDPANPGNNLVNNDKVLLIVVDLGGDFLGVR